MTKTIAERPLPKKLYQAFLDSFTGYLDVSSRGRVWMNAGNLAHIELSGGGISYSNLIVQYGFADASRIESVLQMSEHNVSDQSMFLHRHGVINDDQLEYIKKQKIFHDLSAIFQVDDEVSTVALTNIDEKARTKVTVFEALFTILRFFSTPDQISLMEERLTDVLIMPQSNLPYILPALNFDSNILTALKNWQTPRSRNDFFTITGLDIRSGLAVIELLKLVDALVIKSRQARYTVEVEAAPQEDDPIKQASQAPLNSPSASAKPSGADSPTQSKKAASPTLSKDERELKAEIEKRLKLGESSNPLTILGVQESSSPTEIKAAYMNLVRRLHPDRLGGTPLESLKDKCSEVFTSIGNAYQMLTNADERKLFIEALHDPIIKGDMHKFEMRRRADLDIQKTKILFKKRDYKGVIPQADHTLAIFPYNPEILAMKAWAIYNVSKDKDAVLSDVLMQLEKALKLNPRTELAHFCKAKLARIQGDKKTAILHFSITLKLNPNNVEAQRELRLLKAHD